ncbi:sugar ABC transporter substrate-binding protein [Lentzea sp. NBRC 105346]|uniref:ABC transporter substrate-binding protein n=1 Tax=Lentzea sp. NBRC 105346 TaxID=3032205 RepID=UPI0024A04E15|nr:extracellular solute-binding protein [Lentzea sp. NBRC 105346]GLZ34170.1 sugar ABC transporter substrate-binding protein [Lentzea sp. NBRC 105346]
MNRRTFLALAGLVATGCATEDRTGMTLWMWSGGLSEKVLEEAANRFPGLRPLQVGAAFKSKLMTNLAGRSHVPDITGLKGEDISAFFPNADEFVDLKTLGADRLREQYLGWKWQQGCTAEGKMIGFPIDTGPTGLFYRADVFDRFGIRGDALRTWDDYFDAGVELKREAFMILNLRMVFIMAMAQSKRQLVDESGRYIGGDDHVRHAWDLAVRAQRLGINAGMQDGSPDVNAALTTGKVPSMIGASWAAADLKSGAPDSKGAWRVAPTPGGAANYGGSFLGITKYCREPERAFEVITWLLSPDRQTQGFVDLNLFPSTPDTFARPELRQPDDFFGGQIIVDTFAESAKQVPIAYLSPYEVRLAWAFHEELSSVETMGKPPEEAWRDAQSRARRIADHVGLT